MDTYSPIWWWIGTNKDDSFFSINHNTEMKTNWMLSLEYILETKIINHNSKFNKPYINNSVRHDYCPIKKKPPYAYLV